MTNGDENKTRATVLRERFRNLAEQSKIAVTADAIYRHVLLLLGIQHSTKIPDGRAFHHLMNSEGAPPSHALLEQFEVVVNLAAAKTGFAPGDIEQWREVEQELTAYRGAITTSLFHFLSAESIGDDLGFHFADQCQTASLLSKKEWVPLKDDWLPRLDEIHLKWQGGEIPEALESTARGDEPYVSTRLKALATTEEDKPWDDPTYRLFAINGNVRSGLQFVFGLGNYFDYLDTCERYAREAALVHLQERTRANSLDDIGRLIYDAPHRPRKGRSWLELGSRSVPGGINTLLVFAHSVSEAYFCLQNRNQTAEAKGMIHVVPSGTFQPFAPHSPHPTKEFQMDWNILREFCEEVLGKAEEVKNHRRNEHARTIDDLYAMVPSAGKARELFFDRGAVRHYYLGAGFDLLTTKLEILTVLLVRHAPFLDLLSKPMESDEGKLEHRRFTQAEIRRALEIPNLLPAGAACLVQALRHFDFLQKELARLQEPL